MIAFAPATSLTALAAAAKRRIILLRAVLLVAVGALLVDSQAHSLASIGLITLYAASEVWVALLPARRVGGRWFALGVGAADLVLVGLGLVLSGRAMGPLWASALLMVLVVAIGHYRMHTVAGAAAVGAFHSWLVARGTTTPEPWSLGLEILFLCAVALYYGTIVSEAHVWRRNREAAELENAELRVLLEILETLGSSLDLHQVCLTIVSKITSVIPAQRCSMLFVAPEEPRCFVIASHDDPNLKMLEIDLQKYPEVRRAIDTRNPVLVRNAPDDPIMSEVRALLRGMPFRSILVVPLTFGDEVLGTLCLRTSRGTEEYSPSDIRFCTAVARASANALKNALLHDQVRRESGRYRSTVEKLTSILDHSPDLILTTDNEAHVTEFNRGAEQLLRRSRESVVGQPWATLFPESGNELLRRVKTDGRVANHDFQFRTGDGQELTLEISASPLKNESGATTGTVWVGRDVTELKSAQLQLLQAKKLSSIGEVISGVAHELNNPLSGVLGFSQLLVARYADGPLARDLEKIYESAVRCQKIVKNLLSFARVHKPERKYLGVNGIIEKTIELRRYQLEVNDIEVVRDFDPELPRTMLDFHQMQQVFLNLINNAHHAMMAVRSRRGRLTVRTRRLGETIQVVFADNGEGMDQDTLERIFDPFFTTKEPGRGTGLGLSVSYGIVSEHGGRIWARSRRGEGASFVIELPIRKEVEPRPAAPSRPTQIPQPHASQGGSRLLVVDDEPLILDLLVDMFDDQDVHVDTAANGSEACRKVRERAYDVVITDVRMPKMNGIDLYSEILALRPEMEGRVIFMTGDLADEGTTRFLAGVNARSIGKPLDIPEVLAVVAETIERGGAGRARGERG
jgi:two-component system NtrC family sensor kinase